MKYLTLIGLLTLLMFVTSCSGEPEIECNGDSMQIAEMNLEISEGVHDYKPGELGFSFVGGYTQEEAEEIINSYGLEVDHFSGNHVRGSLIVEEGEEWDYLCILDNDERINSVELNWYSYMDE